MPIGHLGAMSTSVASKPRPGLPTWLGLAGFVAALVVVAGAIVERASDVLAA